MILFKTDKHELIYPENSNQVCFWTKKWGITVKQLNDAIIETGSINVSEIKKYLTNKGILFSIQGLIKYLRCKSQLQKSKIAVHRI